MTAPVVGELVATILTKTSSEGSVVIVGHKINTIAAVLGQGSPTHPYKVSTTEGETLDVKLCSHSDTDWVASR